MAAAYDVVIVGAGQAGCAAAQDLAAAGLSVLMLDRHADYPHKPCAGGVTEKAHRRYRFDLTPVLRETVTDLAMSWALKRKTVFAADTPVCYMTHRPELDQLCRRQAQWAGAELRIIRQIHGLSVGRDGVTLQVDGHRIQGRWLIGADGANSTIYRLAFGGHHDAGAFAIEGLLPRSQCNDYPPTCFDFAVIPDGYGWLFPKGDHVNIGLYLRDGRRGGADRAALAEYARQRLGSDALSDIQGYPIGTWGHRRRLAAGPVLLVGDAAGMAEPLLGEGIYGALISGQYAAAAIIAAATTDRPLAATIADATATARNADAAALYQQLIASWRRELALMEPLTRIFYGTLPLSFGALVHGLRQPLMRGFAAGRTLLQIKHAILGAGSTPTRFNPRSKTTL